MRAVLFGSENSAFIVSKLVAVSQATGRAGGGGIWGRAEVGVTVVPLELENYGVANACCPLWVRT